MLDNIITSPVVTLDFGSQVGSCRHRTCSNYYCPARHFVDENEKAALTRRRATTVAAAAFLSAAVAAEVSILQR